MVPMASGRPGRGHLLFQITTKRAIWSFCKNFYNWTSPVLMNGRWQIPYSKCLDGAILMAVRTGGLATNGGSVIQYGPRLLARESVAPWAVMNWWPPMPHGLVVWYSGALFSILGYPTGDAPRDLNLKWVTYSL
jgi:hypothetical protein